MFRTFIRLLQQARRANLAAEGKPMPLSRAQAGWTRRRFTHTALATTAFATGISAFVENAWAQAAPPRIAVVGAGIAGLQAAYRLQQANLEATVYEAKARVGGRIQSLVDGIGPGLVVDLGGSFINSDHTDMLTLAQAFDLKLFNRDAQVAEFGLPRTAYFFEGQARSEAEVADSLRPLAAQIGSDAALVDEDFERFAPRFDRLSVSDYLDIHADKIPEPYIRTLVEHSIRSEYGVEPEQSSALQLLFNLPVVDGNTVEVLGNSDELFVVEGGSARIIEALASALGPRVRTGMVLARVDRRGGEFVLTFRGGQVVAADYVVLAIPLSALRRVALNVPLPPAFRRFVASVDLGTNEKVFAGFSEKVWLSTESFVQDLWSDLGFLQAWDETQRQADRPDGALTFYLGGRAVEDTRALVAEQLGATFVRRLEAAVSGSREAASGEFLRTRWAQDPFVRGGYTSFRPGQLTEFGRFLYIESEDPAERQEARFGNLLFAGEHLSDAFYGYMNGAAETGRLAAEAITRLVYGPGAVTPGERGQQGRKFPIRQEPAARP